MKLTNSNYYTPEADRAFWSTSQFKAFDKCEASGLAMVRGEYERPETDALLLGSYVARPRRLKGSNSKKSITALPGGSPT